VVTAADISTIWSVSAYGPAITLDGTNDYVTIPNDPHLQITGSLTMLALVAPSAFAINRYLISKYGCSLFTSAGGTPIFETRKADNSGWDSAATGPVLSLDAWAIVVGVVDAAAATKRVWVNGIPGTAVAKTDGGCGAMGSFAWCLGRNPGVGGQRFAGQITLGVLCDRALSESEILALSPDSFRICRRLESWEAIFDRRFALHGEDALRQVVDSEDVVHLTAIQTVPGVVVRQVAGRNGPGAGQLRSDTSGQEISWKAPGSETFGLAVDGTPGGLFLLRDGVDRSKWVRVEVYSDFLRDGYTAAVVHLQDRYNNEIGQDDLTAEEAAAGDVLEYQITLENAARARWITHIKIWLDAAVEDLEVSDDGISWVSPTTESTALEFADLAPADTHTLYLKRTIGVGADFDPDVLNHLRISFFGL